MRRQVFTIAFENFLFWFVLFGTVQDLPVEDLFNVCCSIICVVCAFVCILCTILFIFCSSALVIVQLSLCLCAFYLLTISCIFARALLS